LFWVVHRARCRKCTPNREICPSSRVDAIFERENKSSIFCVVLLESRCEVHLANPRGSRKRYARVQC
jgi:hypothetical protein